MTNESIRAAFERFWLHVVNKISGKADINHNHSWDDIGKKIEEVVAVEYDGIWEDRYAHDTISYAQSGYIPANNYVPFTEGIEVYLKVENYNINDDGTRVNVQTCEGNFVVSNGYLSFELNDDNNSIRQAKMYSDDDSGRYRIAENAMGDVMSNWDITMTIISETITTMPAEFLPEGVGGGVTSWNDLTDRPFYDESRVLYNGYPEYAWGYAKLPVILKEGVSYDIGYVIKDGMMSTSTYVAQLDEYGRIVIEDYGDESLSFSLQYTPDDTFSSFYPYGDSLIEGRPEESDDGSYAYTSKVEVYIQYLNQSDAGVVTINPKYIPEEIQRVGGDVELTSPNGTKYKLSVADDGTLSAVTI